MHELSIPRVLATALSRSGVTTAGEVSQCSRKWLAENVRYAPDQPIGLHSLRQLGRALRVLGLDFGTGGPPVPGPEPSPEPRRRAETDLGRGGPPIARRRSRSVVLDLPRQAPRIRDRSQKRAVALNARGYAACAMTIQELLPFGLPYTYVELLPPRGITMAGELASCTGPDLERMFPDRRFWLRLDEVGRLAKRLRPPCVASGAAHGNPSCLPWRYPAVHRHSRQPPQSVVQSLLRHPRGAESTRHVHRHRDATRTNKRQPRHPTSAPAYGATNTSCQSRYPANHRRSYPPIAHYATR